MVTRGTVVRGCCHLRPFSDWRLAAYLPWLPPLFEAPQSESAREGAGAEEAQQHHPPLAS